MNVRRMASRVLPPLVPAVLVTAVFEILIRGQVIPSYLLPAPSRVVHTLATNADLWKVAGETTLAAGIGFLLSVVVGVLLAVVLSSARWIQRAFYPYAVFFQTVPIIAIAPLLVIWIGYGIKTVIASAFVVSVFPVIANTLAGLLSTDPALKDMFRLYNAGPISTLAKLKLPAALPSILTGLRIAGGLAVIGAIVGEFITGDGIGGLILVSRQQQRVDRVFAGLLLAAGLGILIFWAIGGLSRLTLRHWSPSEVST